MASGTIGADADSTALFALKELVATENRPISQVVDIALAINVLVADLLPRGKGRPGPASPILVESVGDRTCLAGPFSW